MKKYAIVIILLIALALSLCACGENESNLSIADGSEKIVNDSSSVDESIKVDESSITYEKLEMSDFSFTSDKNEYSFEDTITLTLTVNSEHTFTYGEYYYVEYFDGEWKKCEADYIIRDIAYVGQKEATIEFKLSERADKGREKYRAVIDISMDYDTNDNFTICSNEFLIKDE